MTTGITDITDIMISSGLQTHLVLVSNPTKHASSSPHATPLQLGHHGDALNLLGPSIHSWRQRPELPQVRCPSRPVLRKTRVWNGIAWATKTNHAQKTVRKNTRTNKN